jgi:hypothetical protein
MRTHPRPRRYVAQHWMLLLKPVLRYSATREAFVLRVVGGSTGPVLRVNRRHHRQLSHTGVDRRRMHAA